MRAGRSGRLWMASSVSSVSGRQLSRLRLPSLRPSKGMSGRARAASAIVFVGYQAADTLGCQIVDGTRQVRVLGRIVAQLSSAPASARRKPPLLAEKSDAGHRVDAKRIFASYQKSLPPDRRSLFERYARTDITAANSGHKMRLRRDRRHAQGQST